MYCPSMDEWVNMWYTDIRYSVILLNHEKVENPAFCDNMDEPWRQGEIS